jgi:hypothetical protein
VRAPPLVPKPVVPLELDEELLELLLLIWRWVRALF